MSRKQPILYETSSMLFAFGVVVALAGTASAQVPPDHFQCYEVKPGFFPQQTVTVQDQFGSKTEVLRFPTRLCNPTDKNGEGIIDPTDHLTGYRTRAPKFTKVLNQTVVNQFGSLLLDVKRTDILMVPTSKDGVPQNPPLDHFQCYKVKRSRGTPRFVPIAGVTVVNQFESVTVTLTKPVLLCAPANKNNEDPTAPSHPDHLLCYKTKDGSFGTEEHTISNQFGLDSVTVIHRRELCVPSLKNPVPTTTSTSTTSTTTEPPTTSTSTSTSSSTTVTTTSTSTTSTTVYGSPSRAFVERVRSLLD